MESKVQDIAGITIGLGPLTLSGLTAGATTYTSVATAYAINGRTTTFATQSGVAFPTTDLNTSAQFVGLTLANTGTVFVVGCQFGVTTLKCVQGSVEALDAGGNFLNVPKFPSMPDNFCPLAYFIAKAGATFVAAAWYPGTTNWNTTGMTYVANVAGVATAGSIATSIVALPDRPTVG
jgi:hypothetical protein